MAPPYIGEIRMFGGNFAPAGWMFCDGALLPISENEALFNVLGTTYGGDGQQTFALPDLRGRVPVHQGGGLTLAETGGAETVTLNPNQIPRHSHPFLVNSGTGTASTPRNNVLASAVGNLYFPPPASLTPMNAQSILPVGGSQPHENMQPYLCVSFIISLFGIFPSPN
jgi:microcystin-dependent protein